jgi:predicted DNA-binding ribbon-helix-helix protein
MVIKMKKAVSFTLEEENIQQLKTLAHQKKMTVSDLVDSIIELYLLNNERRDMGGILRTDKEG